MMLTTITAGTVTTAVSAPLTVKDIWTLNTGEDGTTTREGGAEEGAKKEPRQAQRDLGGRGVVDEPWTPALTGRGTIAEDGALEKAITWKTSTNKEEEEEKEGGTGAEISFMTPHHPQSLPESWSHWRNQSMSCW